MCTGGAALGGGARDLAELAQLGEQESFHTSPGQGRQPVWARSMARSSRLGEVVAFERTAVSGTVLEQ